MVLGLGGCRKSEPPPPAPPKPSSAQSPASAVASAPAPPTPTPLNPDIETALRRWNEATRHGDGAVLAELYADKLDLYGQFVKRDDALKRKLDAWRKSPGFTQTIDRAHFSEHTNGDVEATFDKTSGVPGKHKTVRGYLLLRLVNSAWRVVDEGDYETNRVLKAKRDTFLASWGARFFDCPECLAEEGGPPEADPPLGPIESKAEAEPPPGAPKTIGWARLPLERFASAVDVWTFTKMSPLSGNGDGRLFSFELASDAGAPRSVFSCAAGGFWYDDPQPGKPDPGHREYPEITATEETRRDAEGIHFDKFLYAPDRIRNFLLCVIDPTYEQYFMPIARHVASSMRVASGGMYHRVERARSLDGTRQPMILMPGE